MEAYPQLTELDLQAAWDYDHSFPDEIAAAIALSSLANGTLTLDLLENKAE